MLIEDSLTKGNRLISEITAYFYSTSRSSEESITGFARIRACYTACHLIVRCSGRKCKKRNNTRKGYSLPGVLMRKQFASPEISSFSPFYRLKLINSLFSNCLIFLRIFIS